MTGMILSFYSGDTYQVPLVSTLNSDSDEENFLMSATLGHVAEQSK